MHYHAYLLAVHAASDSSPYRCHKFACAMHVVSHPFLMRSWRHMAKTVLDRIAHDSQKDKDPYTDVMTVYICHDRSAARSYTACVKIAQICTTFRVQQAGHNTLQQQEQQLLQSCYVLLWFGRSRPPGSCCGCAGQVWRHPHCHHCAHGHHVSYATLCLTYNAAALWHLIIAVTLRWTYLTRLH